MTKEQYTEVSDEELQEQIAIGMHTGLRKGSEAPDSGGIWKVISLSETTAWSDAAKYCVWGLRRMGYEVRRKVEAS